ncbi:hypothetical protein MCOR29_009092 [Pyricularia oryzae]|nr:hypothetical protein MCOR29_009092 [Pyricularia oryzae]KAI6417642.1 hypothetical protein MCOR21_011051 [Pyricularia oryzae]
MHYSAIFLTATLCAIGAVAAPTPNNALDITHVGHLEARSSIDEQRKEIEKLRAEAERRKELERKASETGEKAAQMAWKAEVTRLVQGKTLEEFYGPRIS